MQTRVTGRQAEIESPLDFSYIQIAIKQYGKPFRHRTKRIQRMQNEDASLTLSNYRFANLNGMQTNNEWIRPLRPSQAASQALWTFSKAEFVIEVMTNVVFPSWVKSIAIRLKMKRINNNLDSDWELQIKSCQKLEQGKKEKSEQPNLDLIRHF